MAMEKGQENNVQTFGLKTALCFFILISLLSIAGEMIGTHSFPVGPGKIVFIPMVFTMLLSLIFTPDVLGRAVPAFKKFCGEKEVKYAENSMMLVLLLLGVKMGTAAGPNLPKLLAAGPALVLQEFGNMGTMIIGLPIALLLGMRREAVGATVSICREPTLGLISEIYGINSAEGLGVMGTYMVGNLFGSIFFGLLGSLSVMSGLDPRALAMACGMGSGSMMTAATQSLTATVPAMAEEISAFAATSNIMTNVTGLYMDLFVALPCANFLYKLLVRKSSR
ncbi:hypothetical protein HMPREF7215_0241 [Pyramidobacter piscolens W5455]|uniref:DUF3100 domain-containing protein n=1 Tax=Pyramidobacter piscolens W5455 TaxID=352165 RepID=A0ABM9ZU28_9BACT|nr:DUF3100 domain-containing protein [Pyramidobacter piscolens]EFB90408.1 hypothetical protein HMPREF7215_0241 [Pyramidobacter piscolens W5455]